MNPTTKPQTDLFAVTRWSVVLADPWHTADADLRKSDFRGCFVKLSTVT